MQVERIRSSSLVARRSRGGGQVAGGYRDLVVFQEAYRLALELHKETIERFPQHENYELGSQLRRASKSVAINMAEGYGKRTKESVKEFVRFLRVAQGSADEVMVELTFSRDLGYISEANFNRYSEGYDKIGRQLSKLIESLEK